MSTKNITDINLLYIYSQLWFGTENMQVTNSMRFYLLSCYKITSLDPVKLHTNSQIHPQTILTSTKHIPRGHLTYILPSFVKRQSAYGVRQRSNLSYYYNTELSPLLRLSNRLRHEGSKHCNSRRLDNEISFKSRSAREVERVQ